MLDKKALRKFTADNPAPAIPPGHGLLHAPQVDYIVRTAVKIIARRRMLVLYVYDRERAASGDSRPVWTMFQAGEDYITLARREDGSTRWRTAAFENLGRDYYFKYFKEKCAFYSTQDEERVCGFFRDHDHSGMAALTRAQQAILDKRLRERLLRREEKVLARMEGIPALPGGVESWARREILPAYFIYGHARKGVAKGVCSSCGHGAELSGVRYKGEAACPHCGREMTMISKGRTKYIHDRGTGVVLQRMGAGLIVRILKIQTKYQDAAPAITITENARQFVSLGPDGAVECGHYYLSDDGNLTKWKAGIRPVYYSQPTYESTTDGYLFCGNLPEDLAGTPWQYCPIVPFYRHDGGTMTVLTFLWAHIEHPRYEHLVKMGFYKLVCDMVYHSYRYYPAPELDETQNRTHRLLGVGVEDVGFLRDLNTGVEELQLLQAYHQSGVKDRQKLLAWQIERKIDMDLSPILAHTTPHKLMRYVDGQYNLLQGREGKYGGLRYDSIKAVVREYADYLDMCEKQHYDLKNSFVLFPKDLQKSHDRVAERIKIKADMKMREDFQAAYKRVKGQLDFEWDGMKIVYPASLDEIVDEGHILRHCVGGYVGKVAAKKTMILFLRRCDEVEKPFYTVEVLHGKVEQVRGAGNQAATPEVAAFMDRWERQVLRAPAAA